MRLRPKLPAARTPASATAAASTAAEPPRVAPELARDLMDGGPLASGAPRAAPDAQTVAAARVATALDNLTRGLAHVGHLGDALTARVDAAARALDGAQPLVKPGQPSALREPIAEALTALRAALLAQPEQPVEPPLRAAIEALVHAYTKRAYDLSLPSLGLGPELDRARFLDGAGALADVPVGTSPMAGAPTLALADGAALVPGQFRQYRLTAAAAQAIVADIDLPAGLVAFVGRDPADAVPYVQIGVIGPDNYPHALRDQNPDKLVYGRRWRVEPSLPDYEVVQTVFAAARDARDHEIREMLVVGGRTPFSGHVDAPSLAALEASGTVEAPANPTIADLDALTTLLSSVRFAGRKLVALELERRPRTGHLDVVFELEKPEKGALLPGFDGVVFEARAEGARASDVLHGVMEALRRASVRELEETFRYQGEPRFSREKDPQFLGLVSALTRNPKYLTGGPLSAAAAAHTLAVEQARAPTIAPGPATDRAVAAITAHGPLVGIPPKRALE